MPPQQSPSSKIKWNEVTWYSKLGALILFLGIVPTLCFYIGTAYESVVETTKINIVTNSTPIVADQNTRTVHAKGLTCEQAAEQQLGIDVPIVGTADQIVESTTTTNHFQETIDGSGPCYILTYARTKPYIESHAPSGPPQTVVDEFIGVYAVTLDHGKAVGDLQYIAQCSAGISCEIFSSPWNFDIPNSAFDYTIQDMWRPNKVPVRFRTANFTTQDSIPSSYGYK